MACEVVSFGGTAKLELTRHLRGKKIAQIASSNDHVVALSSTGQVWLWGNGEHGQLGCGADVVEAKRPVELTNRLGGGGGGDGRYEVVAVAAGQRASACITSDGDGARRRLWMWGDMRDGEHSVAKPTAVDRFDDGVLQVCIGDEHVAVLVESAGTQCWTWSHSGATALSLALLGRDDGECAPSRVAALDDEEIVQLAVSRTHALALSASGAVFAWGENRDGLLAVGSAKATVLRPRAVARLQALRIVEVRCGEDYSLALSVGGHVYAWGRNRRGVLGAGDTVPLDSVQKPLRVHFDERAAAKKMCGISCGVHHAAAWDSNGEVYTWGNANYYRLGHDGLPKDLTAPRRIDIGSSEAGRIVFQVECDELRTHLFWSLDRVTVWFKSLNMAVPASRYPRVADLVALAAGHWKFDASLVTAMDGHGNELKSDADVRHVLASTVQSHIVLVPTTRAHVSGAELVVDDNNTIVAATSSTLIDALCDADRRPPDWLKSTCLLTYAAWGLSAAQLLDELMERFRNASRALAGDDARALAANGDALRSSSSSSPNLSFVQTQRRRRIETRVLSVLSTWIRSPHFAADFVDSVHSCGGSSMIDALLEFVDDDVSPKYPTKGSAIKRWLLFHFSAESSSASVDSSSVWSVPIDERSASNAEPPTPLHAGADDVFRWPPRAIAEQLTVLEFFHFFAKVRCSELVGAAWTKQDREERAPSVLRSIRRFNNVSEWTAASILRAPSARRRVQTAERFVDIAGLLLHELRNYSTAAAILAGLLSTPVVRLQLPLSRERRRALDELSAIMSPLSGRSAYREHFGGAPMPKLPFLGSVLGDLTYIEEEADFRSDGLVNVGKHRRTATIALALADLQQCNYALAAHADLCSWLWLVRGFVDHARTAWALSKAIDDGASAGTVDELADQSSVLPDAVRAQYALVPFKQSMPADAAVSLLEGRTKASMLRRKARLRLFRSWLQELRPRASVVVEQLGAALVVGDALSSSHNGAAAIDAGEQWSPSAAAAAAAAASSSSGRRRSRSSSRTLSGGPMQQQQQQQQASAKELLRASRCGFVGALVVGDKRAEGFLSVLLASEALEIAVRSAARMSLDSAERTLLANCLRMALRPADRSGAIVNALLALIDALAALPEQTEDVVDALAALVSVFRRYAALRSSPLLDVSSELSAAVDLHANTVESIDRQLVAAGGGGDDDGGDDDDDDDGLSLQPARCFQFVGRLADIVQWFNSWSATLDQERIESRRYVDELRTTLSHDAISRHLSLVLLNRHRDIQAQALAELAEHQRRIDAYQRRLTAHIASLHASVDAIDARIDRLNEPQVPRDDAVAGAASSSAEPSALQTLRGSRVFASLDDMLQFADDDDVAFDLQPPRRPSIAAASSDPLAPASKQQQQSAERILIDFLEEHHCRFVERALADTEQFLEFAERANDVHRRAVVIGLQLLSAALFDEDDQLRQAYVQVDTSLSPSLSARSMTPAIQNRKRALATSGLRSLVTPELLKTQTELLHRFTSLAGELGALPSLAKTILDRILAIDL
jgi:RasGEF domain/Regulator of chromosome condensation (RCC1) repeat/RasGEF N-terminal motif